MLKYHAATVPTTRAIRRYTEKESTKSLQSKQRARMQPKMGKMDIDYQVSAQGVSTEASSSGCG
eukprot:1161761-Pelagomonas_calceolata.AAC.6